MYKSELISIVYKVLKLFTTFFFKKIQNPAKFGGLTQVWRVDEANDLKIEWL